MSQDQVDEQHGSAQIKMLPSFLGVADGVKLFRAPWEDLGYWIDHCASSRGLITISPRWVRLFDFGKVLRAHLGPQLPPTQHYGSIEIVDMSSHAFGFHVVVKIMKVGSTKSVRF